MMNWKEFLKPEWRKVILTAILFLLILWLGYPHFYPLDFYEMACVKIEGGGCFPSFENPISFIIDVIIWYLLSCPMAWIYDKVKKK